MRIGSRTYECTYGLFRRHSTRAAVSFIGAVLQFWREHCMQKNAKGKYFVLQDEVDPCTKWIRAP